jgi:hypothetical protein
MAEQQLTSATIRMHPYSTRGVLCQAADFQLHGNSRSLVPRVMPLVLGRARRSGRGATGGAEHIRSSLSVVLTDDAPVSTAAVASSRPREHAEG